MVRRTVLLVAGAFALAGLSLSAQDPVSEGTGRSQAAPLSERIGRTDPSKFRHNDRRHEGAAGGHGRHDAGRGQADADEPALHVPRRDPAERRYRPSLPHARGRDVRDLRQRSGVHDRRTDLEAGGARRRAGSIRSFPRHLQFVRSPDAVDEHRRVGGQGAGHGSRTSATIESACRSIRSRCS